MFEPLPLQQKLIKGDFQDFWQQWDMVEKEKSQN